MKKVFIISVILLTVILALLGIYNFIFKKQKNLSKQVLPITAAESGNENIQTNKDKIKLISSRAVTGAIFDKSTESIFYFTYPQGILWKVDQEGNEIQQLDDKKIINFKNALWSPNKNKIIITTENDGQAAFYLYDVSTKTNTKLKDGLDNVIWDSFGSKIFYKYYDAKTNERTLNVANPDGSQWQKLADISYRNLNIAKVPLSANVSYWNSPEAQQESAFQIINAAGGEVKTIIQGYYGADYLWSPDGSQALISSLASKDNNNLSLGVVNIQGQYQSLNIPTLVSKVVWSSDGKTIYYALPGDIPTSAKMPDDYQNKKFTTNDTFWKMDITTGKKERLVEASEIHGKFDLSEPFLSSTEDALYFINRADQKLYKLDL